MTGWHLYAALGAVWGLSAGTLAALYRLLKTRADAKPGEGGGVRE